MSGDSVNFDPAAAYYDETRGFPPGEAEPVGAFIGAALAPARRVLEIGIGTGRIALPVAPHVATYYGVDLSTAMMARLCEKRRDEPIYLAQADATRLPFADHCLDAVVSVHVFHLIADWQVALSEVARVLKPGAWLFNCWNDNDEHSGWRRLWQAWEAAIPYGRPRRTGVDFLDDADFLINAGWQKVSSEAYTYIHQITPGDFLDRLRRRVYSSQWSLTDDALAAGIAAVEATIVQDFGGPDTVIEQQVAFRVQAYLPPGSGTA
jgi:SAM-dependent methyltransferase